MNHMLGSANTLAAYLYAPAILLGWGGGYAGYVLVPVAFLILVALCVQGLMRRGAHARPRLWIPVLLLPAIWIFIGIWGRALAVEPGSQLHRGGWVGDALVAAVAFSLVASIFFIIYQRGARLFLTCYSLINLYMTVAAWFISAMLVTGSWI
jgi:hypothetical protein